MQAKRNEQLNSKIIPIKPEPDACGQVRGFVVVLPGNSVASDIYNNRPIFMSTRGAAERLAKSLPHWVPAYAVCPATMTDKDNGTFDLKVNNVGAVWKDLP